MKAPDRKQFFLFLILTLAVRSYGQNDSTKKNAIVDSNMHTVRSSAFTSVAADPQLNGNGMKRFLIGKNYRREWTQPVTVPVLDLKTENGGLVPKKEGGGKETRSLQVTDTAGRTWALRSVKKYPSGTIPPELRKTMIESLVKDDIASSYPYGVLSMSILSQAAKVPYLKDKLVYIPDDAALGEYRSKFKNSLSLLEERFPEGIIGGKPVEDEDEKAISTEKLVYELAKTNSNRVDQLAVLRVRLLDNFVMDFDRHEGQWTWFGIDSSGGKIYYPIPKDRDQVFYINQGFLTKFVAGKGLLPELQGFRAHPKNIIGFNRAARNFDRFFLNELTEEDWSEVTDDLLHAMTDSVIEAALRLQPKEIQQYSAEKIVTTLKQKRATFKEDMLKYYKALSKTVAVVGSNEREQFNITKNPDGKVLVSVYKIDSLGNASSKIYERLFDPNVTKEIQLYGLEDDDRFIAEGGRSKIKIRMIGGPGNDRFTNHGSSGKLIVYDVNSENNSVVGKFDNKISGDPQNNTFTRLGYDDNIRSIGPAVQLGATEGIFLGLKLSIKTHGFRKEPYASKQSFAVTHALNSSSFRLRYNADFIGTFNHTDLLIRGDIIVPTNRTNFFGWGNNTTIDRPGKDFIDYYHARYDLGNLSLLARKFFGPSFQIQIGPAFQYVHLRREENESNYVRKFLPADSSDVYAKKYYTGGELHLILNTTNSDMIPTRGVIVNLGSKALAGINPFSKNNIQTAGNINFYTDFSSRSRVVFATSFGGGHNFGQFEIAQAQYLGFTDNLRGFRAERFAGRSVAYNNTELRIKLTNINIYISPAVLGVFGFNDLGRVWYDGESSTTWHHGYGWGIWLAPVNRIVVTGALSYSKEQKKGLPMASIGFRF